MYRILQIRVEIVRQGILRFLLLMVIPLLFVVSGHFFVLQRTLNGPTPYLTIRGDTLLRQDDGGGFLKSTASV